MAAGGHRANDYDIILGRLICDRLGVDPHRVPRESLQVERIGESTVWVKLDMIQTMPAEELRELEALARHRWLTGEARD